MSDQQFTDALNIIIGHFKSKHKVSAKDIDVLVGKSLGMSDEELGDVNKRTGLNKKNPEQCALILEELVEELDDRNGLLKAVYDIAFGSKGPVPNNVGALEYGRCFAMLPAKQVHERIKAARNVDIFNSFFPNIYDLIEPLKTAAENGACIRLAMMSPKSSHMRNRAAMLNRRPSHVASESVSSLGKIADVVPGESIRIIHDVPTSTIYRIDDFIYVAPFLRGGRLAVESPQMGFPVDSDQGKIFLGEFQHLWDNGSEFHKSILDDATPALSKSPRAAVSLFPRAETSFTPPELKSLAEEFGDSTFRFARYAVLNDGTAKAGDHNQPIVTGLSHIFPLEDGSDFIRFEDFIPYRGFSNSKQVNKYNGIIIPYENYIFLIGDEKDGRYPIIIGLERFRKREQKIYSGLILRKHYSGPLFVGRILFKRLDGVDFNSEKERLEKSGEELFMSEDEFMSYFEVKDTERIENHSSMEDGRGLIELSGHFGT